MTCQRAAPPTWHLGDGALSADWARHHPACSYLEDGSLEVVEPREENSGMPQGRFLRRHRCAPPGSWHPVPQQRASSQRRAPAPANCLRPRTDTERRQRPFPRAGCRTQTAAAAPWGGAIWWWARPCRCTGAASGCWAATPRRAPGWVSRARRQGPRRSGRRARGTPPRSSRCAANVHGWVSCRLARHAKSVVVCVTLVCSGTALAVASPRCAMCVTTIR